MKEIRSELINGKVTDLFYQAISVYIKKTQVVNRKLDFASNIAFVKIKNELMIFSAKDLNNKIDIDWKNEEEIIQKVLKDKRIEYDRSKFEDLKDNAGIFVAISLAMPKNALKYSPAISLAIIGKIKLV